MVKGQTCGVAIVPLKANHSRLARAHPGDVSGVPLSNGSPGQVLPGTSQHHQQQQGSKAYHPAKRSTILSGDGATQNHDPGPLPLDYWAGLKHDS